MGGFFAIVKQIQRRKKIICYHYLRKVRSNELNKANKKFLVEEETCHTR